MVDVAAALAPPGDHVDTVVQAQIRACITAAVDGLDPVDQVGVALDVIELLQLHILTGLANIRRDAARQVLDGGMSHADLAKATGVSVQAINRLSTESRQRDRWSKGTAV